MVPETAIAYFQLQLEEAKQVEIERRKVSEEADRLLHLAVIHMRNLEGVIEALTNLENGVDPDMRF